MQLSDILKREIDRILSDGIRIEYIDRRAFFKEGEPDGDWCTYEDTGKRFLGVYYSRAPKPGADEQH